MHPSNVKPIHVYKIDVECKTPNIKGGKSNEKLGNLIEVRLILAKQLKQKNKNKKTKFHDVKHKFKGKLQSISLWLRVITHYLFVFWKP
jgi:hypothetical protein